MTPAYFGPVLVLGALGATARYYLDSYIGRRFLSTMPWGTLVVNVSGSLLLGLLAGAVTFAHAPAAWSAVFGTGFCGAFTTFSTFSFETLRLVEEGALYRAAVNVALSVSVGLLAAGAGLALGASL